MKRFAAIVGLVILAGCNNPVEEITAPPSAPEAPTVTINIKQDSITTGQPVQIEVCGTGFNTIQVSPGGFTVAKCDTLTDYPSRSVRYRAFASGPGGNTQASDSVTVKPSTTMPLDSMATIIVRTQDGMTAKVDSMAQARTNGATTWTKLTNATTPHTASVVGNGSSYIFALSRAGYASRLAEWTPDPRTTKTLLVDLTPLPTIASDSGVLNVYSSPRGMRAKVYTALYGSLLTTQTTDFDLKVKAGGYVVVCEDPEGKRMADTAYAVVPAGGSANAVCDNPLKPEPPAPPPPPRIMGKLLATCTVAGVKAEVRKLGSSSVLKSFPALPDSINVEAGFYSVTYTAPAGYVSRLVPPVAVNVDQRTVSNCDVEKEVAPPPPPPPPAPTTGTLVLTDNIDGPVEMKVSFGGTIIGAWLTDTTLTNRQPGEYIGKCVKPGSGGQIIGEGRAVVEAGKTAKLICIMGGTLNIRANLPEMQCEVRTNGGIVGIFTTPTTLRGMLPGEYTSRCVKPGSNDLIGEARATLEPGGEATLLAEMRRVEGSS